MTKLGQSDRRQRGSSFLAKKTLGRKLEDKGEERQENRRPPPGRVFLGGEREGGKGFSWFLPVPCAIPLGERAWGGNREGKEGVLQTKDQGATFRTDMFKTICKLILNIARLLSAVAFQCHC